MRKIFLFLCITGVFNSFAQTRALVGVTLVKPKMGQENAFEDAWKAHLKKFHQADTSNRRGVFEITSGPRGGWLINRNGRHNSVDKKVKRVIVIIYI